MSKPTNSKAKGAAGHKVQPIQSRATKLPKVPHLTAEQFETRLKKVSPWYQSIIDPVNGAGARIPDPCGFNTACYQYVRRDIVPVNVAGMAGLRVINPFTIDSDQAAQTDNKGNYQVTCATSTAADLKWSDGNTDGYSRLFKDMNQQLALGGGSSLASLIRPVSGCIMATYTGSSLNNAGSFVAYTNPAGIESNNSTADRFRQLYGVTVMPCKANRAAIARLLPVQRAPIVASGGTLQSIGWDYRSFMHANANATDLKNYREFGIFLQGATANTGSVEFTTVINYEFIPRFANNSFISVSPSPHDPVEESFVLNAISSADSTGSVSMTEFARPPSASGVRKAQEREHSGPLSAISGAVGFLGPVLEFALPLLGALL